MTIMLLKATITVLEIEAVCPHCNYPMTIAVNERDDGSYCPEGPDQFPLCEDCGMQYEVPEFQVTTLVPPQSPMGHGS